MTLTMSSKTWALMCMEDRRMMRQMHLSRLHQTLVTSRYTAECQWLCCSLCFMPASKDMWRLHAFCGTVHVISEMEVTVKLIAPLNRLKICTMHPRALQLGESSMWSVCCVQLQVTEEAEDEMDALLSAWFWRRPWAGLQLWLLRYPDWQRRSLKQHDPTV